MKTLLLFLLLSFNLNSQVITIVMENYSIFQIPTNMDFNEAVQMDSIKNALLYPYRLTYEFDFNNRVINMFNDGDWFVKCEMLNVIPDGDHFKVFAKVNSEYYTFFLCKDVKKQIDILICLEFTESEYTQGIYSDVLKYSIK